MKSNRGMTDTESPVQGTGRGGWVSARMRLALAVALVAAAAWGLRHKFMRPVAVASASSSTLGESNPPVKVQLSPDQAAVRSEEARPVAPTTPPPSAPPPLSPFSRDLVSRLVQPAFAGGPVTPENAAAWKALMEQTISLGAEAVPAIREFLARNVEYQLGEGARELLGYNSARTAVFDVLLKIGGAEGEGALASTLAGALDPREIALLSRNLDTLAPGQHAEAAVDAARQALAAAAGGSLDGRDVAPAFEVLNRFGGPAVAAELEQAAGKWNYYATAALAKMPDGAGVPSLIKLAQGLDNAPTLGSGPAMQMLASLAADNEQARAAFLEIAKSGRVPPNSWAGFTPILAGDRLHFTDEVLGDSAPADANADVRKSHVAIGNQNFWTAAPTGAGASDQYANQLKWLDQLASVASSPAAQAAVQRARGVIDRRISTITQAPPPP